MRRLRIGILDLVTKSPNPSLYGRVMNANLASIGLHEPWVSPCRDHASFLGYLARCDGERSIGFIARERESGRIVGVVNLSEIVRGYFQSAYMGYYGMAGMNGRGLRVTMSTTSEPSVAMSSGATAERSAPTTPSITKSGDCAPSRSGKPLGSRMS